MRFFIINTDYPRFTRSLYDANPGLDRMSFGDQLATRDAALFGTSDFYPRRLRELGHEADEVHFNNQAMQLAWAREHGLRKFRKYELTMPWARLQPHWDALGMREILLEQVRQARPDVVLCHDMNLGSNGFFAKLKKLTRLLLLQVACPLNWNANFSHFDLILSSLPGYVERFQSLGHQAELFRLGFDPIVLEYVPDQPRDVDISFVGSLSPDHPGRINWLEALCKALPVQVWGEDVNRLPADSSIRHAHKGAVWGRDMYAIMRRSQVTLNYHIDIAGRYANNMRLYEATGCGACLVTDSKDNINDIFQEGSEVITYDNTQHCIEQIRLLLENSRLRQTIARQGQERTLRDHTYALRMKQLVAIVEKYLH